MMPKISYKTRCSEQKKEAHFLIAYIFNPTYTSILVLLLLFDFIFVKDLVVAAQIL